MVRAIGTLVICALYGALGTAMVRFLYKSYLLIAGGTQRGDMSVSTLLLDEVQIREFAILGAGGGLGFGLLVLLVRLVGWLIWRARQPKLEAREEHDTNELLRADRERRVDDYMAKRTT